MDLKEELISDTIDDVMGDDDEEEERYILTSFPPTTSIMFVYIVNIFCSFSSEGIVQQVFDELGLQWDDEVCLSLSLSQPYVFFYSPFISSLKQFHQQLILNFVLKLQLTLKKGKSRNPNLYNSINMGLRIITY